MPVFAKARNRSVSEKSYTKIKKMNENMARQLAPHSSQHFTVDVNGKFTPQQDVAQSELTIAPSSDAMERQV